MPSDRSRAAAYADELLATLARARFLWSAEDELQRGLAAALEAAGHEVEREVRLNPRDRIDLLVDRIGIEVKIAGARRDVQRQLRRYLTSDLLDELILVTAKAQHLTIPTACQLYAGKRLYVHHLGASGL